MGRHVTVLYGIVGFAYWMGMPLKGVSVLNNEACGPGLYTKDPLGKLT